MSACAYISLAELAARLGVHKVTLLRWVWAGRVSAVRVGAQWVVSKRVADRLERELRERVLAVRRLDLETFLRRAGRQRVPAS
jgi:excisionase family DNA binding protein